MAITYKEAGVDIEAGEALVDRIRPLARLTRIPEVIEDVGGFAGICAVPQDVEDPLLVSGTDGVGTKLKVAFATGKHDTIGIDLVAMCVNDVITTGARPLFFLDYFACGKLDVGVGEQIIRGIADGCKQAACALLGGETAELPTMYPVGEYDLAGFCVGVVARREVLGPHFVDVGDELVGVASSGIHSNGYSLARRVLEQELKLPLDAVVPELGVTLGEALLKPTRIYVKAVAAVRKELKRDVHALCHVTGGGVPGNLPRVLPKGTIAHVTMPPHAPIFQLIERGGPVELAEMRRTFNLGVGFVLVVAAGRSRAAIEALRAAGEEAFALGVISAAETPDTEPRVEFR